jgi:hypothetical protein
MLNVPDSIHIEHRRRKSAIYTENDDNEVAPMACQEYSNEMSSDDYRRVYDSI